MNYHRPTKRSPVDQIVARFTREILGEARKENVSFQYAGNKGDKADEINRVMRINSGVVKDLLRK